MARTPEQVFVKVDGEQLELGAGKLIEVMVDQTLDMPDYAEIKLIDGMEWLTKGTFDLGKEVKIDLKLGDKRETMFIGLVMGADPVFTDRNLSKLTVRCFDRAHLLLRGKKTKTFEQMKDSDIAQRIAAAHGLGTDLEQSPIVHDHVYQHNQSDLEFLQLRAGRNGYEVGVSDKTLYFKTKGRSTRPFASTEPVKMKWGEGLQEFSVRVNSSNQVQKVTVRGWNPVKKEAVIGEATASNSGPDVGLGKGGRKVDGIFGTDATMTYVSEVPIYSQEEADSVAQAKLDEIQLNFITGDGTGDGNPAVQPGALIDIKGLDAKFEGKYLVSDSTHSFRKGGYSTKFRVGHGDPKTGRQPRTGKDAPSFSIGIVTDNHDPDQQGRVRVKLPSLGADIQTYWARIVAPNAGNDRGFFWLPEINDEVLVAFEQGEAARPLVLGAMWNGKDRPPEGENGYAVEGGSTRYRIMKSRAGHQIVFDDSDGDEKVSINDKKGNKIVFECRDDKLVIDFKGDIEIKAGRNLTLEAGDNLSIEAGRNLKAKGLLQTEIEGMNTSVKATGPLQLQGVPVNVNNGAITVV